MSLRESAFNWTASEWTVRINLTISHIYNFGEQPVSLALDGRAYAVTSKDQNGAYAPSLPFCSRLEANEGHVRYGSEADVIGVLASVC
jgi:hypothetical protein